MKIKKICLILLLGIILSKNVYTPVLANGAETFESSLPERA